MIIPTGATDTRMTTAKRQTLADFLYYSLCAGQTKAGPYGYSPLPLNLVQAGFDQIAKLKAADPAVDLTDRDVSSATTRPSTASTSRRTSSPRSRRSPPRATRTAPARAAPTPGTNEPSTDDPNAPTRAAHRRAGRLVGGTGGAGAGGRRRRATVVDPDTGTARRPGDRRRRHRADGTGQQAADFPAPTELAASRPADTTTFGWVAAVLLVALVLLPGLLVSQPAAPSAQRGAA